MSPTPPMILRPATAADCARVLVWRNHPAVRQVMFTSHEIGTDEHAAWWQRIMADPSYCLLILNWQGQDCGIVNFSAIDRVAGSCDWGFYFNPDAFSDGLARLKAWNEMEKASLAFAAQALGCTTIGCEVIASNAAVLSMHGRYGFRESGRYERRRDDAPLTVIRLERRAP